MLLSLRWGAIPKDRFGGFYELNVKLTKKHEQITYHSLKM